MRVLGVVILVLLVRPAFSQVPDDRLIDPGVRIGKATLAMHVDALVAMLGPTTTWFEGFPHFRVKTQPGVLALDWIGPLGLGLATRDDREALAIYTCGTSRYQTAKGVRHGATPALVESANGKPTATFYSSPIAVTVIYDNLGLAVVPYRSTQRIECIAVFRPGSARRIWKF